MIVFFIFGVLAFVFCMGYLLVYLIRKVLRQRPVFRKKVFFPLLIGSFLFIGIGSATDDDASAKVTSLEEEKEALESDVADLEEETEELQVEAEEDDASDELDDLTKELDSLKEDHEDLKKEHKKGKKEYKALQEDYDDLKDEKKDLKKDLKKAKKETKKLEEDKETLKKEKKEQKEAANNEDNGSAQEAADNSDNAEEEASNADNDEDCDIKGSDSGIYHVPGSTYYSRTTNVAEWFCSEAEAKKAGYRAPKQ